MSKLSREQLNETLAAITRERNKYYLGTGLLLTVLDSVETLNVALKRDIDPNPLDATDTVPELPVFPKKERGFTLLGLMSALVIVGILFVMANAAYIGLAERARVTAAIGDIGEIHITVQRFLLNKNRYPESLAEMGFTKNDPWGNLYIFARISNNGEARKDHNMVPVNRDYDIYSIGKDGQTASPLQSTVGGDDVVMAGSGTYFGLASNYLGR